MTRCLPLRADGKVKRGQGCGRLSVLGPGAHGTQVPFSFIVQQILVDVPDSEIIPMQPLSLR